MPALFAFAKPPRETRGICAKANVLAEMLLSYILPLPPSHPPSCLCWFHFSAAAAYSCLGNGSGPRVAAVGVGVEQGMFFESGPLLPLQPEQAQ